MKLRKMMSGAGSYLQGQNILAECGDEIKRQNCKRAFIIGGKRALAAALENTAAGLEHAGIPFSIREFTGFCTAEEIAQYSRQARQEGSDCIIGIGGGKALDVSKAVAAELCLPVFTIPTSAATCAAFAALSILYNGQGCQESTRYHSDEVRGVFVDTQIISHAPPRYLAAGMADAMAKACEYSSIREKIGYGDLDISKYLGYCLADAYDKVLLSCGRQAHLDNCAGIVTEALEDAVFVSIAATGIVSGMGGFAGRTGSRFSIAHGFNEVIRGRYTDTTKWLHGEIVAVGILAQLNANGLPSAEIEQVRSLYNSIGVPTTLEGMGIILDNPSFEKFQEEIVVHSRVSPQHENRVRQAVASVRKEYST